MSRFIPINAEAREFPAAAVIAYCYQSDRGPAFVAYKGRQGKPARFFAFGSVERRDDNLAGYVKQAAYSDYLVNIHRALTRLSGQISPRANTLTAHCGRTPPTRDMQDAAAALETLATGGTLDLDAAGRQRAAKLAHIVRPEAAP